MPVVQYRIKEVSAVHWIPSDFLNPRTLTFLEDHPVKEFITLLHANVFPHNVVNIVVRIQNFNLDVKKSGFAFDPYKISRFLVKQFSVDIDLHLRAPIRLNSNSADVRMSTIGDDY